MLNTFNPYTSLCMVDMYVNITGGSENDKTILETIYHSLTELNAYNVTQKFPH